MKPDFNVKVGETLILKLIRVEGDTSSILTATCKIKKAGVRGTVPPQSTPVTATLTTVAHAEGWDFIMEPADTLLLDPGFYVADATLTLTGNIVDKTEAVLIEVLPSVT
jgi:hypothetical protein